MKINVKKFVKWLNREIVSSRIEESEAVADRDYLTAIRASETRTTYSTIKDLIANPEEFDIDWMEE